ncbi:MAG: trehalose-6-phosphate synthase [Proteobacteria bacterium]|nr:trehalose-6-phosphate synthase [Pseudomonadota bacterium]
MTRLVNVSNRVALPGARSDGGLAVGLLAAMHRSGGLWFGWSGRTNEGRDDEAAPEIIERNNVTYATLDLPETLFDAYYNGFANGTLWPLLHSFLDRFQYRAAEYQAYADVNARFARALTPLLHKQDLIWVHDYHLITLGSELRRQGVAGPIGFFLHVPFPHYEVLRALPSYRTLMSALLSYDVLGFQTELDRHSFLSSARALWGEGCVSPSPGPQAPGRRVYTGVFPIGVDVEAVSRAAGRSAASRQMREMTQDFQRRKLVIGVDRLDYSKGLLERFEAYQHFLESFPQYQGGVSYLQIAPLGRQSVEAYTRIRATLEQRAGRTNGRFASVDWTPIRYLNRNFPHATLMALLRTARVCLVTPLRDGMNLVAKEFVAAQDPKDPGVLVLSDRAGAACELGDALLVNPYDTQGIAGALKTALDMPLAERRMRHERMLTALREHDLHQWSESFTAALRAAGRRQRMTRNEDPAGVYVTPRPLNG